MILRRLWLISTVALATLAGAAGTFWALSTDDPAGRPALRGALKDKAFQFFRPPRDTPEIHFTDKDGNELTLADFRGQVVLLNYWATWCAPCVEEMPALDRLQAKLGGKEFTVVAISVDRQGLPLVEPFLDNLAIRALKTYLDRSGGSMRAFKVRGLPTTMIIDREGKEVARLEGIADWASADAEMLLRYYLNGSPR